MKRMRTLSYGLLGLLLAGCQSENLLPESVAVNGEENILFTVSAPEVMQVSRATLGPDSNSALGGLSNVDFSEFDLRYQLAVYRVDGEGDNISYTQVIVPQTKIVSDGYEPVTYALRLTPERNYKVVVWADFVREGETDDLHYDTSDFGNIRLADLPLQWEINDESRDAYFGNLDVTVANNTLPVMELKLKRPFAKLRVVTTDWNYGGLGEELPDKVEVTYYGCKRFLALNALNGETTSMDLPDTESAVYTASFDKTKKDYAQGYDKSENNRTLVVDYLLADAEQTPVHLKLTAKNGETIVARQDLKTSIPIQRNWLTTIIGNALTVGGQFNVIIDDSFTNEWIVGEEWWKASGFTPVEPTYDASTNTYMINNREEFMWLPDHIDEMLDAHPGFTLRIGDNIDMSGVEWKPIYPNSSARTYTVDGQGFTLRNFSMSGKYGAIYEYKLGSWVIGRYEAYTGIWGKFDGIMRNINFENITINGLANNKVHYDVDGNQIDHSQEYAYFAGIIGYTGGNQWSMDSKFENVHAKHVSIKSSKTPSQNLGGLIGWMGSGGGDPGNRVAALKNCSAEDIHLSGYQAGGLIGQILGDRGVSLDNCYTNDVYIRYNYISASSGFIGNIGDGGITISWSAHVEINNCTVGENVQYIKDSTGEMYDYIPDSQFYGHKNDVDVVTITPEP